MNIITKWLRERADKKAEAAMWHAKAEQENRERSKAALITKVGEVKDRLVESGFVMLGRYATDDEYELATTWAHLNGVMYEIEVNQKGGMTIERVK